MWSWLACDSITSVYLKHRGACIAGKPDSHTSQFSFSGKNKYVLFAIFRWPCNEFPPLSLVVHAGNQACAFNHCWRHTMTTKLSAATLVLALGSALSLSALTTTAHAADDMQKCFGVAEAGKNDQPRAPVLPALAPPKPKTRPMPGNWSPPARAPRPQAPPRRPVLARKRPSPPNPDPRAA